MSFFPSYTRVLQVPDEDVIQVLQISDLGAIAVSGLTLPFVTPYMRITADGHFQLFNSDQNKYHTLLVQGAAGAEYITIGAGET